MSDPTLDEMRVMLAAELPAHAAFDGWTPEALTLAAQATDIEALRRALAVLALPQNLARATKLGWRAADAMWHAAGDTATDFNHYSKRAILGTVYMATIMAMIDDDSEGHADTRAFLGRRIDGIMRFEKFKGRFSHSAPERLSLARFLGRLRYPAV